MAFRFETANERWKQYKESFGSSEWYDLPKDTQAVLQHSYSELGKRAQSPEVKDFVVNEIAKELQLDPNRVREILDSEQTQQEDWDRQEQEWRDSGDYFLDQDL